MDNLPLLITATVAIVSCFSPFITAYLNNKHLLRIKELEIGQENFKLNNLHKRELFETYLSATSKFMIINEKQNTITDDDSLKILTAYNMILPYIPKDKAEFFRSFSEQIVNGKNNTTSPELWNLLHNEIIPCIKKEIEPA